MRLLCRLMVIRYETFLATHYYIDWLSDIRCGVYTLLYRLMVVRWRLKATHYYVDWWLSDMRLSLWSMRLKATHYYVDWWLSDMRLFHEIKGYTLLCRLMVIRYETFRCGWGYTLLIDGCPIWDFSLWSMRLKATHYYVDWWLSDMRLSLWSMRLKATHYYVDWWLSDTSLWSMRLKAADYYVDWWLSDMRLSLWSMRLITMCRLLCRLMVVRYETFRCGAWD